jgi:hypothetical protein
LPLGIDNGYNPANITFDLPLQRCFQPSAALHNMAPSPCALLLAGLLAVAFVQLADSRALLQAAPAAEATATRVGVWVDEPEPSKSELGLRQGGWSERHRRPRSGERARMTAMSSHVCDNLTL